MTGAQQEKWNGFLDEQQIHIVRKKTLKLLVDLNNNS